MAMKKSKRQKASQIFLIQIKFTYQTVYFIGILEQVRRKTEERII
jgi:hypothetical protein